MNERLRDIPKLQADGKNLPAVMEAVREALQTFRGFRGDDLDRAMTLRDLDAAGRATILRGGEFSGGGTAGPVGPIGPAGPGGTYTPDLTPPPTPTGLVVTAGLTYIYVSSDVPVYTQGHGHDLAVVYGAKWPSGSPPTFAAAVELFRFNGPFGAYATDTGTRWCIWIKWKSIDNVLSVSPAGGTNGAQATTGVIGTSDLGSAIVLAGNLAPGSVTADKAAFEIGGDNLLANNSFEVDTNSDGYSDGWGEYNNSSGLEPGLLTRPSGRISGVAQRIAWSVPNTTTKGVYASMALGGGVRGGWVAGKTYVVSCYAKADTAKVVGMALEWNTPPPASVTALRNPNLATTWQRYAFRIVWGGTVEGDGRLYVSIPNGSPQTGWIDFDDFQVEEGDILSGYFGKLALNTIVAGDGAIGNLAIVNAMVANGTLDNAKIASLNVDKLVGAALQVGAYIQSTNYTSGAAGVGWRINANGTAELQAAFIRGQLVAAQINTNDLDIRDGAGTVIFSSGVNLAAARFAGTVGGSNVIPFSAFAADTNADGVPDGWASYVIGATGVTTQLELTGGPDGGRSHRINATAFGASDRIGITPGVNFPILLPPAGGPVTMSAFMAANPGTASMVFFIECKNPAGAILNAFAPTFDASAPWTFCKATIIAPAGTTQIYAYLWLQNGNGGAGAFVVAKPQIEAGDVATAWRPAMSDKVGQDNPITAANISTFIASAAIGNAQIGGDIQSDNFVADTTGWRIRKVDGSAEFEAASIRGQLTTGQIQVGAVNSAYSGIFANQPIAVIGNIVSPSSQNFDGYFQVELVPANAVAQLSFNGYITLTLLPSFGAYPAGNYDVSYEVQIGLERLENAAYPDLQIGTYSYRAKHNLQGSDVLVLPVCLSGNKAVGIHYNETVMYLRHLLITPVAGGSGAYPFINTATLTGELNLTVSKV